MTYLRGWLLLLVPLAFPLTSLGQWQVKAGAQVPDCLAGGDADLKLAQGCQVRQAMAFIPNEIWIHQNDSITWTHATDEGHTVTFLYQPQPATLGVPPYPAAQQRPSGAVGCTAYGGATSPNDSAYDPSGTVEIQGAESAAGVPRSKGAPEFDHSAFVIAYTTDNLGHVIYPSGVSEADWLHDLPRLARETWTGR